MQQPWWNYAYWVMPSLMTQGRQGSCSHHSFRSLACGDFTTQVLSGAGGACVPPCTVLGVSEQPPLHMTSLAYQLQLLLSLGLSVCWEDRSVSHRDMSLCCSVWHFGGCCPRFWCAAAAVVVGQEGLRHLQCFYCSPPLLF